MKVLVNMHDEDNGEQEDGDWNHEEKDGEQEVDHM